MCTKFYLFTILSFYYFSNSFGLNIKLLKNDAVNTEDFDYESTTQQFSSKATSYELQKKLDEDISKLTLEIKELYDNTAPLIEKYLKLASEKHIVKIAKLIHCNKKKDFEVKNIIEQYSSDFLNFDEQDRKNLKNLLLLRVYEAKYIVFIAEYAPYLQDIALYGPRCWCYCNFFFNKSCQLKFKPDFFNLESESFLKIIRVFSHFNVKIRAFQVFAAPGLIKSAEEFYDPINGIGSTEELIIAMIDFANSVKTFLTTTPLQNFENANELQGDITLLPVQRKVQQLDRQKKQKFTGLYSASPLFTVNKAYRYLPEQKNLQVQKKAISLDGLD